MNFYQCNTKAKITDLQIVDKPGFALDARENNPDIEGSLRNLLLNKVNIADGVSMYSKTFFRYDSQQTDGTCNTSPKWIKLGTLIIRYRYSDSFVVGEITQHNTANVHLSPWFRFRCLIKQQDELGKPPLISLWITNPINFTKEQLKVIVIESNSNGVTSEIYCQINNTYATMVATYPIMNGFIPEQNMTLIDGGGLPVGIKSCDAEIMS